MGYGNFNARIRARVIEGDSDNAILGTYKPPQDTLLKHIYMHFYIQGVSSVTNETVTLKLHTSDNLSRTLASSTAFSMSTMFTGTTNYIGKVRIDFDSVPLSADQTYYISIQTANYTRSGDTFYFALQKDFPFTTNGNGSAETAETPLDYAAKFEVFGDV